MSNIKDISVSFTNLIKSRSKNPFYGTLVLVYILRNYKEIFQLFSINQITYDTRIKVLESLFNHCVFITEIANCIWIAFIAMTVSYILINFSELLKGIFKNVVNVWINKLIDLITNKTNTYSKEDYVDLESLKNDFEKRYNAEREMRLLKEKEVEELESKIKELLNPDTFNSNFHQKLRDKNYIHSFRKLRDLINEKQPLVNLVNPDFELFELLVKERVINLTDRNERIYDFTNPKGETYVEFFNNWDDKPRALGI